MVLFFLSENSLLYSLLCTFKVLIWDVCSLLYSLLCTIRVLMLPVYYLLYSLLYTFKILMMSACSQLDRLLRTFGALILSVHFIIYSFLCNLKVVILAVIESAMRHKATEIVSCICSLQYIRKVLIMLMCCLLYSLCTLKVLTLSV